ncbi:hypothetical protein CAter282_4357 [Collimonas arenae]|uniref:Uncharacterized protein n=1 Tax=Collimonas arenae TaxID=279058 RepID=A0A127QPV4_9BURK|nr:hypothetical protein [Collimonas arenae]AMP02122.1 hypothetical protein CAter10_4734 [Collimonas arenae]AMP12017.1 hypothetical protein CAter282_4357 [Collimonas arenae]
MNAATDKKPTITLDKRVTTTDTASPLVDAAQSSGGTPEKNASENLREVIKALDAERTELVKNTIENIKPGKPLDLSVVREINKLETKKNRLIVARFASLLKKSGPEVQTIVHQIIEI